LLLLLDLIEQSFITVKVSTLASELGTGYHDIGQKHQVCVTVDAKVYFERENPPQTINHTATQKSTLNYLKRRKKEQGKRSTSYAHSTGTQTSYENSPPAIVIAAEFD
jgi:hypothetical protein